MITPAFGLTATERVLPKLALDFTTGTLDSRITFTRALNTATVIGSSGLLQTVNADIPRFDYDPTTLACKGLLIEESSTNLLTYSEDFSNAAWSTKTNITVAPSTTVDPAGGTGAFTLTATSTNAVFGKTFTGTAGLPYTFSFWIRRKTGTGAILAVSGDLNYQTITSQVTSAWNRVSVPSLGTSTTTIRTYIVLAASGDEVEIYGAQSEQKAFGTSYIRNLTTGTTTRNADVATMTGTNFSDWYNQTQGALYVEATTYTTAATDRRMVMVNDGTNSNQLGYHFGSVGTLASAVSVGGVFQYGPNEGAYQANTVYKRALAYIAGSINSATNGVLATGSSAGALVPTVNKIDIGNRNGAQFMSGHVRKIMYYPQRLLNAEIRAITS